MGSNAITDQNQGGGDKKAGFPYQIGRESWTSVAFHTKNAVVNGTCCSLKSYQTMIYTNVQQSRPIGSNVKTTYWRPIGLYN
jgi:hypothetical protein